ncbi:MAG: FAD-dependent oxidoreductase [Clostridia bacterium]|nr:FAD-dependent oxidoreductase [Clostridia bacterium]
MNSVWEQNIEKPTFSALNKSIKTDVLIIGGGIAGILCAYMLKNAGIDCVLVEANRICGGITKNTTAKLTLQHGLIYSKIIKRYGKEKALMYFKAQKAACDRLSELCSGFECDFENKDSFVYSMYDKEKIKQEASALKLLGADVRFCRETTLPFKIEAAVCVKDQAQFHPLKLCYAVSKNLPIYENTKVLELLPNKAITNHGEIDCKKIIVSTHFPLNNKHGMYFLKLYQHRSYVIALENAQSVNGMFVDASNKGLSFRNYKNLLLLGGGGHRTGKQGGNWKELERFANKYYPEARIVAKWATQDCMSLDGIPYIGQYSASTCDLFVATGFNKWGMSSSMLAAMLLSDMIQGKKNKCASVFSPSRSMLHLQLAVNAFESIVGLLTPSVPRCPHLGCALKYNKDEHSWDCSCHGSRFDENGALLDNPATDDKIM